MVNKVVNLNLKIIFGQSTYNYDIITIIIEYAWMCLYKQDSEYTSGPTCAKILNMANLWMWQGSKYASITQRSARAIICLDRVLNIPWVLNMLWFWIW